MRADDDTTLTPYGICLLRVTLAILWLMHGLYKVIHDGMPATEKFFVSLGYPAWTAWADVAIECAAFVLLLLGAYVRVSSVLLLFLLIPATLVWIPKGFFFTNGGYEFPLIWCVLQVVMALCGPGALRIRRRSGARQMLNQRSVALTGPAPTKTLKRP
jgi:putative oxidoreductase